VERIIKHESFIPLSEPGGDGRYEIGGGGDGWMVWGGLGVGWRRGTSLKQDDDSIYGSSIII